MSLFEINPDDRWLFAFTHPDDEISILSFMKRLTHSDASVYAGWSVATETREREARRVMQKIGVPQEHLRFFRMPDKGACDHLSELTHLWKTFIEQVKPSKIAMGAFECGHIDHDSTHFAITHAVPEIQKFEIPWYHTYLTRMPVMHRFADPSNEQLMQLTKEEWDEKKSLSKLYKSQNIASLLRWYWLAGKLGLRPGFEKVERMRELTNTNYEIPNLPEPLKSKVMQCDTWNRWQKAIKSQ